MKSINESDQKRLEALRKHYRNPSKCGVWDKKTRTRTEYETPFLLRILKLTEIGRE
jgi:hypothetical protein